MGNREYRISSLIYQLWHSSGMDEEPAARRVLRERASRMGPTQCTGRRRATRRSLDESPRFVTGGCFRRGLSSNDSSRVFALHVGIFTRTSRQLSPYRALARHVHLVGFDAIVPA